MQRSVEDSEGAIVAYMYEASTQGYPIMINSNYLHTKILFKSWGFCKARYQDLQQKEDQLTDINIRKRLPQPIVPFLVLLTYNRDQSKMDNKLPGI